MGGDCLNFGCVPSKALIRSAKFLSHVKRANEFGVRSASRRLRVQGRDGSRPPRHPDGRAARLGRALRRRSASTSSQGEAQHHLALDGGDRARRRVRSRRSTTRAIVIAAGAAPFVPPIPGIEEVGYVTSDTLWELRELPQRLVVLGGGPIGCELAQCFARLGSKVTQVEMLPRIMITRGSRDLRDGRAPLPPGRHRRARRHQGEEPSSVVNGEKVMVAEHDGQGRRDPVRRAALRRRARRAHQGLRPRGARHPGDEAAAPSR